MTVIPKRTLLLPVLGLALATALAAPAQAARLASPPSGPQPLYFSASLTGADEVSIPGDPDGSAKAEVVIEGSKVTFAYAWKKITAPTMSHLHTGAAGVNGPESVPLFTSAMPDSTSAAAGVVSVDDAALVSAITAHPENFYLNLHTAQFPAGAVRGQLSPARRERDPLHLLHGLPLQTLMSGTREVPAGDPEGQGIGMIRASGKKIAYTFAWSGIGQPMMGHVHVGGTSASGPIVVPLFMSPVPEHVYAITGEVRGIDKHLVTTIRTAPTGYYVNLHTMEYPAGAIRGQLNHAGHLD